MELKVFGVHIDGGMRERVILPTAKLHRSRKLTMDQLALVETLGIGRHAVSRAAIGKGEKILVLGAGPIGLSVIPFAQAAGGEVIVADVSESRLAFCREKMKVKQTLDARGDLAAALKENGNDLPTLIFDASGNAQCMMKTFELAAHGGRIVFVGLVLGELTFNDPNFHRRELSLLASRNALPGDFTDIIKLIEDGVVDTTPWITHRSSAQTFVDVLPSWLSPDAQLLKAVVEF
jgi:2-desacetyl-2-hydroxyethyl bacteriochlorophyllide A dehydrogenase